MTSEIGWTAADHRARLRRIGAQDEREAIVRWIRHDLAMNRAADSFALNSLANAIENRHHYGIPTND